MTTVRTTLSHTSWKQPRKPVGHGVLKENTYNYFLGKTESGKSAGYPYLTKLCVRKALSFPQTLLLLFPSTDFWERFNLPLFFLVFLCFFSLWDSGCYLCFRFWIFRGLIRRRAAKIDLLSYARWWRPLPITGICQNVFPRV